MTKQEILQLVDHTLLAPASTWEQIRSVCDDAMLYHTASVCIPPVFVGEAVEYVQGKIPICTVIGFPNGYNETEIKCQEAALAVQRGASEIDMVIQIGWVKEKKYAQIIREIQMVKGACNGKLLKVIIETCLLTKEEIAQMCDAVYRAGADYIKTSTGFSKGGATVEDIRIMREASPASLKIKAAGGISSFDDAQAMIDAGANRLGTSRLVKLMKEENV